jgi:hypothetical protein
MKLSPRYGSHLPPLIKALSKTHGPVLELGMGFYSTPLLHAVCVAEGRQLVSLDSEPDFVDWGKQYATATHSVVCVRDWDQAVIERPWDVVLVDHAPANRRAVEAARLAPWARYILIHDSNGRYEYEYHLSAIYPLFKYRYDWTLLEPATVILSNLIDLADFERLQRNHAVELFP